MAQNPFSMKSKTAESVTSLGVVFCFKKFAFKWLSWSCLARRGQDLLLHLAQMSSTYDLNSDELLKVIENTNQFLMLKLNLYTN